VDSWKPQRRPIYTTIEDTLRRRPASAAIVLLAAVPLLGIAALAPPPLILPIVSLVLIAAAGIVAWFAWRTGAARHAATVTAWDLAGALAFVGFAAAILSKPENVLLAFAGTAAG
jgi:hypothetical protein